MALFVAVKFAHEEMPQIFDPGTFQDIKPQDFVVALRGGSEDVGFVACLEHKSTQQLKLRREPYPRVIRLATPEEVEGWWRRKALEKEAMVVAKAKVMELRLDIKISHVRFEMKEPKAVFQFTSEQRVDFRQLVKELTAALRVRVDLWQMGIRDEARYIDGFGVCGLQTCCSTWLTDFRAINIRMAKDQDIHLPPAKLSGQCGRLLCCLSYEVDQYRQLNRSALPKGATVTWEGEEMIIIDRNLIAGTYTITNRQGTTKTVKAEQLAADTAKVPEQMKTMGRRMAEERDPESGSDTDAPPPSTPSSPLPRSTAPPRPDSERGRRPGKPAPEAPAREPIPLLPVEPEGVDGEVESMQDGEERSSRRNKKNRRRGGRGRGDRPQSGERADGPKAAAADPQQSGSARPQPHRAPEGEKPPAEPGEKRHFRPKKRRKP